MMATMIVIRPGKSGKSICRLCFTEQEDYQSIAPLREWIKKLTSLTITNIPSAPFSLCMECKATLKDFESFREMCLTNDRVFMDTYMKETEIKNKDEEILIPLDPAAEKIEITTDKSTIEANMTYYTDKLTRNVSTQVTRISKTTPNQCQSCGKFKRASTIITYQPDLPTTSPRTSSTTSPSLSLATSPSEAVLHPPNDLEQFVCEKCGKSFAKKSKYNAHLLVHSKVFACEFCSKGFPNAYLMKVHTRVHTGEKPYICNLCNKGFFSRFNLNQHQRSIHSETRDFSCRWCLALFTSFGRKDRHERAKLCLKTIQNGKGSDIVA